MPVLIRIAFRNLREHKSKSVIIGSLIVLGVIIIVLGNSLLDGAERGIHGMFIDNYTGDVFISGMSKTPGATVSLFGVTSGGDNETTPVLPEFDAVRTHLEGDRRIDRLTSQLTGAGMVTKEGNENMTIALLFGVDPATYPGLFPDTFVVEGRYLQPGEDGIVVSRGWLKSAEEALKSPVKVGDKLMVSGMGQAGIKIREVTVVGVVDFKAETEGMDMIAWANADTVRVLSGVDVSAEDVVLSKDQTALLNAASEDDIFGATETTTSAAQSHAAEKAAQAAAAQTAAAAVAATAAPAHDGGSWHFILARMKDSRQADAFIRETNAWFDAQGISAHAGGWKVAAGPFVQSIDVVRTIFYIAILIVSIVSVIIIMNTLVISVIERTGEIGTMRALGAQKPFVWLMFLVETLTITIVFGLVGIGLACGIEGVVNLFRFPAGNFFLQMLFGGKTLRMVVKPMSFITTLLMVAGVGLVAHLYPVLVALKIPPVRAMQNE
jgi:putative ABC transport system permease protein